MNTQNITLETAYQNAQGGDNTSLWNLWELDSYTDTALEVISGNPNADSELLDLVAHQLRSPHADTPVNESGLFTDEIIENLLAHKNFTGEAREELLADVERGYYG